MLVLRYQTAISFFWKSNRSLDPEEDQTSRNGTLTRLSCPRTADRGHPVYDLGTIWYFFVLAGLVKKDTGVQLTYVYDCGLARNVINQPNLYLKPFSIYFQFRGQSYLGFIILVAKCR